MLLSEAWCKTTIANAFLFILSFKIASSGDIIIIFVRSFVVLACGGRWGGSDGLPLHSGPEYTGYLAKIFSI